jgi:uncharacterized protein YutE (UPF0331/DUF86 family)
MDEELIAKLFAHVETCVRELREVAQLDRIATDIRERRFVEHTLQIAIQAALDVASHIVSDRRLGEPATNRELFELLAADGWLDATLTESLRRMVGMRNLLVHGYAKVDPEQLRRAVNHHLGDLLAFAAAIRSRLRGT